MQQRLNFITLAVADVARSRAFYVEGLGWDPSFEAPGEVVFLPVADGVVLSLWARQGFADEVGVPGTGIPPMTLAHNVTSADEVDEVLRVAASAGAVVEPGRRRDWGGYSGYFVDPDGFRWEVAHNGSTESDEQVVATRAWLRRHHLDAEAVLAELAPREPVFHREPADADLAHFRAMTTDDFVEVGASGAVLEREALCELMARRHATGDRGDDHAWTPTNLRAREVGPGVWQVAYDLDQSGRRTRRTTTWVLTDTGWKVAHHQGTTCV